MSKKLNLIGNRFGRLVVLEEYFEPSRKCTYWICKCDCGVKTKPISGSELKRGRVQSCGCLKIERIKEANTIHGGRYTKLHYIWQNMKQRCNNSSGRDYPNYGGRGITVCNEWNNSFEAFYEWATANGYNASVKRGECTLDRIDVNGNYEPSNCRWVTQKEQCNNLRKNLVIEIDGMKKTAKQWADESGLNEATIRYRYKHGFNGYAIISNEKHQIKGVKQ